MAPSTLLGFERRGHHLCEVGIERERQARNPALREVDAAAAVLRRDRSRDSPDSISLAASLLKGNSSASTNDTQRKRGAFKPRPIATRLANIVSIPSWSRTHVGNFRPARVATRCLVLQQLGARAPRSCRRAGSRKGRARRSTNSELPGIQTHGQRNGPDCVQR